VDWELWREEEDRNPRRINRRKDKEDNSQVITNP